MRTFLEDFDARLSRFRSDSELSRLNGDPRRVVPASKLLRTRSRAAVWAAERTDGLRRPDPRRASSSRRGTTTRSTAPRRRRSRRRSPRLHDLVPRLRIRPSAGARSSSTNRPGRSSGRPGLQLDSGGTGKGLAADLASELLRGYSRFVVDCGGDMRVGGPDAQAEPYRIEVEHPLTGGRVIALRLAGGGVATSGLNVRIWRTRDGRFAHHLLDPATGEPAWTGLVGVTAIGSTALEAETLAKAALLSGPETGTRVAADFGGVLVHDSGEVEYVGLREVRPAEVRFRLPEQSGVAA